MSLNARVVVELMSLGNARIFAASHVPQSPVASVVLCHGIGEHSGRYQRFIEQLAAHRIASVCFDLRGHGRSSGTRGHVDSFADYVADLACVIDHSTQQLPEPPRFLFGHSMGALVAVEYLLAHSERCNARGLLLSSPGLLSTHPVPRYKALISSALLPILPRFRFRTGIRPWHLSADPRAHIALLADPHTHGRVSLRWYAEYQQAAANCMARAHEIRLPTYVCVGEADPVVSPEGARRFVEAVSHDDKTLCVHAGLLHEPLNEATGERVGAAMVEWILARSSVL